jgi:hypothetical protein
MYQQLLNTHASMVTSGKSMRAFIGNVDYMAVFFRKWRNVILILFAAYMILNVV